MKTSRVRGSARFSSNDAYYFLGKKKKASGVIRPTFVHNKSKKCKISWPPERVVYKAQFTAQGTELVSTKKKRQDQPRTK